MLIIENLTKTYPNGKRAVDDLSLHIKKGEIFGFIGPNGAGKTTTIKSLVGILEFDSGEILIDGVSLKENPLLCKQNIAYIPDNPDLYDYLTGIGYINFVADVYAVEKGLRNSLTEKYADLFDLKGDLAAPVSSYSHGMKQKLALIAALVHRPKLLVLDEPFVGLDPKSAHNLKGLMRELCNEGGAIFFSSHVLDVVEKLCDRIAIIKMGKILACGNTNDLKGDSGLEETFLELTEHV